MERMDTPLRAGTPLAAPSVTTPGKKKSLDQLEMLLDYELRGAVRYRRFATLVLIATGSPQVDVKHQLGETVRSSDELFDLDPTIAILMGETDSAGAMSAINRFKSMCKSETDLRFALASFPADARGTAELLWTAHRRLDEAREGAAGSVISSG